MSAQQADPERIRTRNDLARELTVLRSGCGLTVRDLAAQVGAPVATLGDYFAGRHLPTSRRTPLYLAILTACGVTDPVVVERWIAALTRLRVSPAAPGRAS